MNDSKRIAILLNPRSMRGVGEDYAPPMGLLMASINLYNKFEMVIIDQRTDPDWKTKLLNLLKKHPLCLGVTSLTGKQIEGALLASEMSKANGCRVVWGGVHASLLPEQTLAHPCVDYVVAGEGEESFAELVQAFAANAPSKDIRGVWSKVGGQAVFGGSRQFVNLDKLPPIPYHLIDLTKYIKRGPYGDSMVLYSSRGCPQCCTFCFNHRFNDSRWRAFSAERVLADIRSLLKNHPNVTHVEFWDDNFFVHLKRAKDIAEGIRRLDPRITWSVLGTHVHDVTRMDDDYLACLKRSGLKEVLTGVESGSQRIIEVIKKNFKMEELFLSNKRLANFGIRPTYSFISGIPGERDEDIKATIDTMFRLKEENPNILVGNIKPFICYPGTALYERAMKLGFKSPESLEGWSKFVWGNYFSLNIPWMPLRRKRTLAWLYYYTVLMNPEYMFIHSKIFTVIAKILRPVAEWRVRKMCFRFPVEAWVMNLVQSLVL